MKYGRLITVDARALNIDLRRMISLVSSAVLTWLHKHRLILQPDFGAPTSNDGRVVGSPPSFFMCARRLVTDHGYLPNSNV